MAITKITLAIVLFGETKVGEIAQPRSIGRKYLYRSLKPPLYKYE